MKAVDIVGLRVAIGIVLEGLSVPRPLSHDVLVALVESLDAEIVHVEVTGMAESTFIAELTLTTPSGEIRVDSRPSDAIAVALRAEAPVYASETVLDAAGAVSSTRDEDAIEREMRWFRSFLSDVDPDAFRDPGL